jgi:hypothetical protein
VFFRAFLPILTFFKLPIEIAKTRKALRNAGFPYGAVNQIRTGDLFLTKEVLCHLSYNSIFGVFRSKIRQNFDPHFDPHGDKTR